MSLFAQIGASAAIGIAVLILTRLLVRRPRGAEQTVSDLFLALYAAVVAFQFLHFGDPTEAPPYHLLVLLPPAIYYTVVAIRSLILHWRDDDALSDTFGGGQSYIVRRDTVSPRVRAVILVLFWAIFVLGGGFLALFSVLGIAS